MNRITEKDVMRKRIVTCDGKGTVTAVGTKREGGKDYVSLVQAHIDGVGERTYKLGEFEMASGKRSKEKKPAKKKAKNPTKEWFRNLDFNDEDSVKAAMAVALDVDAADLSIEEDQGMSSFGVGTVYRVEMGREEYLVARNEDKAYELAVASVKQDMESEPEMFEQNFIASHINMDRLRRDLMSDVQNMRYEDLKDEAEHRPEKFIRDNNLDWPKPSEKELRKYAEAMSDEENSASAIYAKLAEMEPEDQWTEMGEEPEVKDSEIETLAEQEAEAQLKDPVAYLEDIYGHADAVKKAIEIGGIDIDAAAKEAVDTDGIGHFLARYDGNIIDGTDGPKPFVYWRTN